MRKVGLALTWGTRIALAVVLCAAVASFVFHAGKIILFPYELAAGEELLLRDAAQIVQGRPLYTDVNDFPFVVSNYPPLMATVSALLIPLVGQSLAVTRLLATLSTLLISALIGGIVYQMTRSVIPGVMCGAAYVGSIFVYEWGAWGRVDAPAICLSLLAILVTLRWGDWRGPLLAALCCLLSLYTKQTQWAAPLAIFVWLLCCCRSRDALGFGLFLFGVGGAAFMLLNGLTGGQFLRHVIVYNALGYSPRALVSYWRAFAVTHGGILTVGVWWAALSLGRRRLSLPLLYAGASALSTVAVGRSGASSNYFLELAAATLILCGLCWSDLAKDTDFASSVVPVILLLQLIWFKAFPHSAVAHYYDRLPSFGYTPQATDVRAGEDIDRYVRSAEGEILTEGGGFALRNGKELYGSPWLLNALEERRLVDEGLAGLEEAIAARRFSLVILTWQSYPPRILEAVWANYRRVDTVDCVFRYEIFLPRQENQASASVVWSSACSRSAIRCSVSSMPAE